MAVVAVCSLHGAPGATALALDLARLCGGGTLLVEADPDGGSLAARLDLAMRPGLTELAGAARVGIAADDVWRFAQPIGTGVGVIVSHPAAEQVQAALRASVQHVGTALRGSSGHVVVDIGRLRPGSPAMGLAAVADTTFVVADNSVESVVALSHRAAVLANIASPQIVLTSYKPYSSDDVEAASGQRVWGVVPSALHAGRGSRRRSRRRALELERLIGEHIAPATTFDVDQLDIGLSSTELTERDEVNA
ncbi:MAG: chromosome partitioning protein [Ilumatobacteraceae bacterium]|nr:chromosome partitioning protein [Ilumatobacteraceae bacterium]MCU1391106.1 chromosome partitioning protein [Ilumatobacteraceae bacterium]